MTRFALALVVAAAVIALPQLHLSGPPPAWAVGSPPGSPFDNLSKPLTAAETKKIELYLRQSLGVKELRLTSQPPEAEVFIGQTFIGVVYPDDRHGQRTFYFEMAIFDSDLDQDEPARSRR
jgi:hypothetical protein